MKIKLFKKNTIPSSPTTLDDGIYYIKNATTNTVDVIVISGGKIYRPNTWGLSGNSGSNPDTDFIGTTDAKDLNIRTNNEKRIAVKANGQIRIGEDFESPYDISINYTKNSPSINLRHDNQDGTASAVRLGLATANGNFHTLAKKNDVVLMRTGQGSNLIIGTNSTTEPGEESKSVIIAPNNAPGYPLVVRSFPNAETRIGIGLQNPSDKLHIDSNKNNDSGVTFNRFNANTPSTASAKPLGITASGKVVTTDLPKEVYSTVEPTLIGTWTDGAVTKSVYQQVFQGTTTVVQKATQLGTLPSGAKAIEIKAVGYDSAGNSHPLPMIEHDANGTPYMLVWLSGPAVIAYSKSDTALGSFHVTVRFLL
jgi:hypothetical protein